MKIDWANNVYTKKESWFLLGIWTLLILLIATIAGCGSEPTVTPQEYPFEGYYFTGRQTCSQYRIAFDSRQYLQDQISPEDYAELKNTFDEASVEWNAQLTRTSLVEVEDDNCVPADIVVRYLDDITSNYHTVYPKVSPCRCVVSISLGLGKNYYEVNAFDWRVVAHEIGHCLGLGHSSDPLNLMSIYHSDQKEILPVSLDLLDEHIVDGLVGPQTPNNPKCF